MKQTKLNTPTAATWPERLKKSISQTKNRRSILAVLCAVLLAITGAGLTALSRAATFSQPIEAEAGVLSGVSIVQGTGASGGQAVLFSSNVGSSPRSIKGQALYVYKPTEWAGRPAAIYNYQVGKWFGNWTTNITTEVSSLVAQGVAANQLPLLVAYNIPGRDCGSYSAGGAGNSANYRTWIDGFVNGLGNRKAIVVLEPDALAQVDCLSAGDQTARIADIAYAVDAFKAKTQASVYIDGGNSTWKTVAEMVDRLKRANVANAAGFSLNVSNFELTSNTATYGDQIVEGLKQQGVAGARYVIDTSRNGQGPAPASTESWCNPPGRGLGKRPTTTPSTGTYADAYLWIKTIGESDGPCNGGPAAGQWFPAYAQALIDNAVY